MDELVQYVRKEKRRLLRGAYLQHLNKSLHLKFDPEGVDRAVSLLVDSNNGNGNKKDTRFNASSIPMAAQQ